MRRLAVVALLLGCGGKPPAQSTTPPQAAAQPASRSAYADLEARIPKIIAAMDVLARDLGTANSECPKIAAALRKWGSEHAAELDALWELKNQLTAEERERYQFEHDDDANRLEPIFDASLASCQGDAEVEDALTVAGFRRAETSR